MSPVLERLIHMWAWPAFPKDTQQDCCQQAHQGRRQQLARWAGKEFVLRQGVAALVKIVASTMVVEAHQALWDERQLARLAVR